MNTLKSPLGKYRRIALLFIFLILLSVLTLILIQPDQTKVALVGSKTSTDGLKNIAKSYTENSETPGTPVTLKYQSKFYNYVPFEKNGNILDEFPGLILDQKGNPVTDSIILKEIFRYPALVRRFSYNVSAFDQLVATKIKAIQKYCKITTDQEKKFTKMYQVGTVWNFIFEGTKLAVDGAGLVSDLMTSGVSGLVTALAKTAVKNLIISTLTKADMNKVMASIKKAFEASKLAGASCQKSLTAWQSLSSRDGKITPEQVDNALLELSSTFKNESDTFQSLKKSLEQINLYPKIITKISPKTYQAGITNLDSLIAKLKAEADYWYNEKTEAGNVLDDWVRTQLQRLNHCAQDLDCESNEQCLNNKCEIKQEKIPVEEPAEEPVAPSAPALSGCQAINLAEDYQLYTYTVETSPCSGYQNTLSENTLKLRCTNSVARWRNYWVKEVAVTGLNSVKIKSDLGLNDYTNFFTECPDGGVKYNNYSSILVLNEDPRPTFDQECNQVCATADWPKCGIQPADPRIIGTCGVAKCSSAQKCDFDVNVTGLDKIYLLYHISDAWPANLEGVMNNLQVCR